MRELDHRVKNTLATVQAVADQTLRASCSMSEFGEAFDGRIQALARIHTALAARRWEGLRFRELIELVVGPYRHHADSVAVECDGSFVPSELVRVLGMTLHEARHQRGQVRRPLDAGGRVAIASGRSRRRRLPAHLLERARRTTLSGEPQRRGFGMRLIEDALAYGASGTVTLRSWPRG